MSPNETNSPDSLSTEGSNEEGIRQVTFASAPAVIVHPAVADSETAIPIEQSRRLRYSQAPRGLGQRRGFTLPSTAEEINHAKERWSEDSWQFKALRFINSDIVQKILVALLLLDVCILFVELAIDAFFPYCKFVIRDAYSCCPDDGSYEMDDAHGGGDNNVHRILAGGDTSHSEICILPSVVTDYQAGCDPHRYPSVHIAHEALFWITIGILCTFEIELFFLMYLLGPKKFCHHFIYIIDLIIVTTSIVLELIFRMDEVLDVLPGLIIIFRLWRFVRIGHGLIASTYEVEQHKTHLAVLHIEDLEERLRRCGNEIPDRPKQLRTSETDD